MPFSTGWANGRSRKAHSSSDCSAGMSSSGTSPVIAASANCSQRVWASPGIRAASARAADARTSFSPGSNDRSAMPVPGLDQDFYLVLEAAGLDDAVHAALLRTVLLPPPPSRARVFARLHRSCARCTADTEIALVIQRVVRHVVGAHIVPHFFLGPVGQRIDFDDPAVVVIQLDLADIGAGGPLIAPQTGDPAVQVFQHPHQWAHLADVAAGQSQRNRLIKGIHTVALDQRLDLLRIREVRLDLDAVVLANPVDQLVGLLRQSTSIDGKDAHVRSNPPRHVQDGHAVDLKAGAYRDPFLAKGLECPANDLLRLVVV